MDRNAKADMSWLRYTFDREVISILSALALLKKFSFFGERAIYGGMLMMIHEFCRRSAKGEMSKAYARKAWRRFDDTGKNLTDFPSLDKQDVLMV